MQANAADELFSLENGDALAELGGLDSGALARRAAADTKKVVVVGNTHNLLPIRDRRDVPAAYLARIRQEIRIRANDGCFLVDWPHFDR